MVLRTDNPVADFLRYDAEQTRWLESLPECADYGEPIQDEEAYYRNGERICLDCMDSYRMDVMPE